MKIYKSIYKKKIKKWKKKCWNKNYKKNKNLQKHLVRTNDTLLVRTVDMSGGRMNRQMVDGRTWLKTNCRLSCVVEDERSTVVRGRRRKVVRGWWRAVARGWRRTVDDRGWERSTVVVEEMREDERERMRERDERERIEYCHLARMRGERKERGAWKAWDDEWKNPNWDMPRLRYIYIYIYIYINDIAAVFVKNRNNILKFYFLISF